MDSRIGLTGGREQWIGFEELLDVVDFAGRLRTDDWDGNADESQQAPDWAHGVEKISIAGGSNGGGLGSAVLFLVCAGSAFPDGPHELAICGTGAELIDGKHDSVPAFVFKDLGLRVKPNGDAKFWLEMVGEDVGEMGAIGSICWQKDPVRQPKTWKGFEIQVAAANADVQCADLEQVAGTISPDDSTEIGGVIATAGSDFAALGVGGAGFKLQTGVKDEQHFPCSTHGGELIIGAGDTVPPTQYHTAIPVKKNTNIYVAARMMLEDGGTVAVGGSIGFVNSGK